MEKKARKRIRQLLQSRGAARQIFRPSPALGTAGERGGTAARYSEPVFAATEAAVAAAPPTKAPSSPSGSNTAPVAAP